MNSSLDTTQSLLEEIANFDGNRTAVGNETDSPQILECLQEGPCKNCYYALNMPKYVPRLIGCGLAFIIGIIIFVLYLIEERRKEKTSYNQTKHEENEEEKNDRDAIAFGTNNVSYVVEQSACGTPKNQGGGFKVLERKPKSQFAHAPPITPFSTNVPRQSRVRTVQKEAEDHQVCQLQIVADRLGRGTELVSLINETDVPVSFTSPEEKANYALDTIKTHLEKMTEEKYMIYGFLDEKQWIFCGAENTLGEFSELRLELKLMMTSPVNLQITAFSVKMEGPTEKQTTLYTPTVPAPISILPPQPQRVSEISHVQPAAKEVIEKTQPIVLTSLKKANMKSNRSREDKENREATGLPSNSAAHKKTREKQQTTTSSKKTKKMGRKAPTFAPPPPPSAAQSSGSAQPTPNASKPGSPTSALLAQKMEAGSIAAAAAVRKRLKEMASGKTKKDESPLLSKEPMTAEKSGENKVNNN